MLGARGGVCAELCSAQGEEQRVFWVLPKYHQSLEAPAGLSPTSCPPGARAVGVPGAAPGGDLVRRGQRKVLVQERRVLAEAFKHSGGKVSEQKELLAVLRTCSWCWGGHAGVLPSPRAGCCSVRGHARPLLALTTLCPALLFTRAREAAGPGPSASVTESAHLWH